MNPKRFLCALLATLTVVSCFAFTGVSAATSILNKSVYFDGAWLDSGGTKRNVHDGIVFANTGTVTDKCTAPNGSTATKITPNPSYSKSNPLGIKHTSVSHLNIPLTDIKYVRYYYYYDGKNYNGRASLKFPKTDFSIDKDCTVYSMEEVRSGVWTYLTFDVQEVIHGYIFEGGCLENIEFYPFGDSSVSTLTLQDSVYLQRMFFWGEGSAAALGAISDGTLTQKYPIKFESGRIDVTGTPPTTIYAAEGETIVLPQNTYSRENYTFSGWICSVGSEIYFPGDTYTVEKRTRAGGQTTAGVDFIAHWVQNSDNESIFPNIKRVNYSSYNGGVVDYRQYGTVTKNVEYDGVQTLKFVPNPQGADASKYNIALDSWTWNNMPLDISHYKYLIIPYYFKTEAQSVSFTPRINFLGSATDTTQALTSTRTITSGNGNIKCNQWSCMVFKFDFINNASLSKYVRWNLNTVVNQFHFFPFGLTKATKLNATDELYVGNFIFMSSIPETDATFANASISGYSDGTFKPNETVSNAEAAVFIAKALGATENSVSAYTETSYSDINNDDWYFGYIAFLEAKGVLNPQSGSEFNPLQNADKAEFYKNIANAKSATSGAQAVGTLPPSQSSEKYISRAAALNAVNSLIKNLNYNSAQAAELIADSSFSDVSASQWFYPDVAFSCVPTISYTKSNGETVVIQTLTDNSKIPVTNEQYAAAQQYVSNLDSITETRISEIRNTTSVYKQKSGGKTIYLSSSIGNAAKAEESTEYNPYRISTLNEVSSLKLSPGDAVLFMRGDTFRGYMTCSAGVTYSAFGYGEKPVLMRSPENGSGSSKWELIYSDNSGKKIWKYYNEEYVDVGAINLINSQGEHFVAYKEIPDYRNQQFWIRGKIGTPGYEFDVIEQLDHNYEFFHEACYSAGSNGTKLSLSNGCPTSAAVGPLYLRCDNGNPGELYPQIEFNLKINCISIGGDNVTVDNICIKYFGSHGIGAGTTNGLTVTNCEIGWGGGSIQHYDVIDSSGGRAGRFGNGVEIYGALTNYTIDNCYVYEIYDAGITHQISAKTSGNYFMEGVYYTNNVLLNSSYNIEYFMSKNSVTNSDGTLPLQERYMKNVYFTNNILRGAGYGWGVQRPDNAPSNIKGWTHHNLCHNYVIENNIFDRCVDLQNGTTDYTVMTGTTFESSTPYFKNNVFVQTPGRTLMMNGNSTYVCNLSSEEYLQNVGGTGNKVYFYPDDSDDYSYILFWKDKKQTD